MNKKQRKNLMRIITAALLMIILNFVQVEGAAKFFLYLVPYLIVGWRKV